MSARMSFEWKIFCFFLTILTLSALIAADKPVTPCADKCRCYGLGQNRPEMDCTRRNLTSIPSAAEWPDNIYALDMSMNELKRIDVMDSSDKLEYLDLASNVIEAIEPNAFQHLTQLRGLDLSHNGLVSLPADLFTEQLLTLNLSHNNIELLPPDLFKKCKFLQELRLAHNPLRILDSDLFRYSSQLKTLDLSAISSFALKDDIFHQLFELTDLDLSDNDFMLMPTIPLRSARSLQVLKLSANPIRVLDEHSFVKMNTLTELYLDDMKELIEIKEKTFSYLYNLQKISISNNPHLSYIDSYAFYGIFNRSWIAIKEANFRANRLSSLPENTLPFCNLTSLDLRENPWTCDCHLLWAKYCHLRPELTHGIICANPSQLRGQDLIMIDHHNIHCESQMYRETRAHARNHVSSDELLISLYIRYTYLYCANPSQLRGQDLIMIDHHNIHCESQMYREVRMMRLFVIVFVCANPSQLRGQDLIMIDHHNIHCESQMYREVRMMRLFVIVFVSFTIFFIGLLFALFIKRDVVMRWWDNRRMRGTGAIYYTKAHSNPIEPEF
ncbi:unnamed protein product [Oppiella nova]|uniref:LRRCT domain-containing protein n=1 Tax=Oppiella nova TaxID=334625 RepID=A0A7R9MAI0_9ACAR|nr:unnamed protein product [Oppiella nova]CAG2173730.1 unnamed protein product [Oppiella nova]